MSSDVTNLHHPGDQIVNRWQWHILRIVTNVWMSLILLLASGWSWSVSECHVSAVAAVGPAHEYSTVFISLAAARMHALTRSRPLCYRPLFQRWGMIATSHFYLWRRVCSERVENVTWEDIFVEILSNCLYSQSTPVTGCWCVPWAMLRMWPNDNITWGLSTPIFSTCTNSDSATMNEVG